MQLVLESYLNSNPKNIALGHDNINHIIVREVIDNEKNAPMLLKAKLGWLIHGNNYVTGRQDINLQISSVEMF